MAEEALPPSFGPIRRSFTVDDSTNLRSRRQSVKDVPQLDIRRRSSAAISELSLNEARRTFQSSTDDLLLPKPSPSGNDSHDSTAWHSAPLAFALLPAIGGMFFKNGSSITTDIMLLGLAAIFLNWSVRLPWDWYHSAQSIRKREEYTVEVMSDSDDETPLGNSQTTLNEVPEDEPLEKVAEPAFKKLPGHETATNELYTHEVLALFSCFVFPVLGAYLLHTIRSQLSRPSEGLVSDYNLTIFLLASELRPMAHLVKLIRARTLHLQRMVNSNPYESRSLTGAGEIKDMIQRLESLEERTTQEEATPSEPAFNGKQSTAIVTEVRRSLQPDLDALNRAVRRYEKRATLQAFQTESKLQELEQRLNDAISLAAAAANSRRGQDGFIGIIIESAAAAIVLPLQGVTALVRLPFRMLNGVITFGRARVTSGQSALGRKGSISRTSSHNRIRSSKR